MTLGIPKPAVKEPPLRLGRFKVSQELMMQDWKQLLPLMAEMVVVRCEQRFCPPTFEYEAFSEMFEPLPFGVAIPEYQILFTREGDKLSVRAEKLV